MNKTICKIKKLYYSIIFYFFLYGFIGGIKFALNLMTSGIERIYLFVPGRDKLNAELINPNLRFQLIENIDQYDMIKKDYLNIKGGKWVAEEGRYKILSGKEWMGIVYKEDILAGWGWIKFGPLKYGTQCVSERDCIIHKCRTVRNCRRQKVYSTLLINILNELQNRKIYQVFIGAKKFNRASLVAIEKVGFHFAEEYNSGNFLNRVFSHVIGRGTRVISYD